MKTKDLLNLIQIIVSVFLGGLILLQAKGTGLGKSFGSSGQNFSTKRGIEKSIFWLTVVLSLIFVISSLVQTVIF